jgi:hypothetical protein
MARAGSLGLSLCAVLLLAAAAPRAAADIVLLGKTSFPGDATDKSNLTDTLADGSPHNRLGGHGSGIAYTGRGNRYVMVNDRGPADGTTAFKCRIQLVDITVAPGAKPAVKALLHDTVLLADEGGRSFVGLSSAFDAARPAASLRFDPEGVRVSRTGTVFLSDEYGPSIYEFDLRGKRLRSLPVPAKFLIARPHAREDEEIAANTSGRVTNKGMEGLAITPDGGKLLGAMQSPLLQDGGRQAVNIRLLEIDVESGASREFLYPLSRAGLVVSEILAVNDREFLVVERDGKRGKEAAVKKVFRIDLAGATDIKDRERLPKDALSEGVVPVRKSPFLDLLDPRLGLAGPDFPAKIEGLAFGPDLPDGRHLLIVTNDNDRVATVPTWIFAFAVDAESLPRFRPRVFGPKEASRAEKQPPVSPTRRLPPRHRSSVQARQARA